MSAIDDLAEASDTRTRVSRLSALAGSPWADVREVVARNPRLPLYLLHRLAVDPNPAVATAACIEIAGSGVAEIRAALMYDTRLTRAVLRACQAYNPKTNTYAMSQADFEAVMSALNVSILNEDLDQFQRDWLVILAEPEDDR